MENENEKQDVNETESEDQIENENFDYEADEEITGFQQKEVKLTQSEKEFNAISAASTKISVTLIICTLLYIWFSYAQVNRIEDDYRQMMHDTFRQMDEMSFQPEDNYYPRSSTVEIKRHRLRSERVDDSDYGE